MIEDNVETGVTDLSQGIQQLEAKISKSLSALRQELKKDILRMHLALIRDLSLSLLMPISSEPQRSACDQITKLVGTYFERLPSASADEFEKSLLKLKEEINFITRLVGFGEIWEIPQD